MFRTQQPTAPVASQPHTQPPLYNRYLAALYLLNCLVLVGTQVTQAPPVDWYGLVSESWIFWGKDLKGWEKGTRVPWKV